MLIDLEAYRQSKLPHATGEAVCHGCKREWVAVAPTEVVELQCPGCLTMKGRFKYVHNLAEGTDVAVCLCKGDIYKLTRLGYFCVNCGSYRTYSCLWE